ncbi:MAG: DUF5683 domain-containing protein [Bacteroidales bacterium]
MNRICYTSLCILLFVLPVHGQDPDTIPPASDTLRSESLRSDTLRSESLQSDTLRSDFLQSDTLRSDAFRREARFIPVEADTVSPDTRSPRKAIMYALVLPGLGQIYNRKYFKVPIVYAALGAAGYAIVFNTEEYRQASLEYAGEQSELNRRYLEYWRRNMELSYIALVAVYGLQILDAYVDAHLSSWDVNENLSMQVAPSLQPVRISAERPSHLLGLTCRFEIRGR